MVYKDNLLGVTIISSIVAGGVGTALTFMNGSICGKFNLAVIPGIAIMIFGTFVLPAICFIIRESASLHKRGIILLTSFIIFSYFFTSPGISPFAIIPMPILLRIVGLIFGIGGNIAWCIICIKACKRVYEDKKLSCKIFVDNGNYFSYSINNDAKMFEKTKFSFWRPAYLLIPIVPLYPLSLVLPKILIPIIGYSGICIFLGLLYIPFSICLNGLLVKIVYAFFYYPRKLTRATGKPVYFADYWGGPKKPYPGEK